MNTSKSIFHWRRQSTEHKRKYKHENKGPYFAVQTVLNSSTSTTIKSARKNGHSTSTRKKSGTTWIAQEIIFGIFRKSFVNYVQLACLDSGNRCCRKIG